MKNTIKSQKKSPRFNKTDATYRVLATLALLAAIITFFVGEAFISRFSGGDFFAVVTRLITAALLFYALFCVLHKKLPRFSKVCRTIWYCGGVVLFAAFVVIEILVAVNDRTDYPSYESAPANYMIVLGAGLRGYTPSLSLASRLDEASHQLLARPEMLVVVSGGQGPGEYITEAQAMYEYLVARGVAPERILKEDRSVNTAQNIAYSLEVLSTLDSFNPENGVIVCSNGYHLFRAKTLLEYNGVTPYALRARVPRLYLNITGYLREYFSVLFMWRAP